jgi:hypothetical protein
VLQKKERNTYFLKKTVKKNIKSGKREGKKEEKYQVRHIGDVCKPSRERAEAGGSLVQGQPGLHNKTQKKKNKKQSQGPVAHTCK